MDPLQLAALADLKTNFPKLSFRYESEPDWLIADLPQGAIILCDPGERATATLKWEAVFEDIDVLAETPTRAVRLLARRANLEDVE